MKKKIKIFFLLVIFFFVSVFLALHAFINLKGRDLLAAKLEQAFGRKATIGSLSTSFPFNLELKNIEVAELLKVDKIVAGTGVIDILRSNFHLSHLKIMRPQINLERNLPKLPVAPDTASIAKPAPVIQPQVKPLSPAAKKFISAYLSIGRFIIRDGTVNFIDKTLGDKPLKITFRDINLRINNLNIKDQKFQVSSFDFMTKVPWRDGQEKGSISVKGWINPAKKNMKATVNIKGIDGVYLYPYYAQWVDLDKARIESAKLQFTSNITGVNNNLTAICHLELSDIVRKPRAPEEYAEKEERVANAILDTFKGMDQGKIILDFTYRTRMDRPEFGFGIIKMAFADKLNNGLKNRKLKVNDLVKFPAKLVKGTVKGVTDVSTAAVVGTSSLGMELAKALKAAFKREPKE